MVANHHENPKLSEWQKSSKLVMFQIPGFKKSPKTVWNGCQMTKNGLQGRFAGGGKSDFWALRSFWTFPKLVSKKLHFGFHRSAQNRAKPAWGVPKTVKLGRTLRAKIIVNKRLKHIIWKSPIISDTQIESRCKKCSQCSPNTWQWGQHLNFCSFLRRAF